LKKRGRGHGGRFILDRAVCGALFEINPGRVGNAPTRPVNLLILARARARDHLCEKMKKERGVRRDCN